MTKLHTFTFLTLLASTGGCLDEPEPDLGATAQDQLVDRDPTTGQQTGGGGLPSTDVCKTFTISGKVFYNDLRTYGRFADRRTIIPTIPGYADPWATSTDASNYLGLYDGKVEIFEVDQGVTSTDCKLSELQGSTQINNDGTWSWHGQVCDACRDDHDGNLDNGVAVAAKIVLEDCADPDTRCFSVRDPGNDPAANGSTDHFTDDWYGADWARWYRGADTTTPRVVTVSAPLDLGVDYFQEHAGLVGVAPTDLYAQAANVFASLVDVTRRVHVDEHLPYDHARWGEIHGYFPSTVGGTSHSHQADRFCVAAPQSRDDQDPSLYQWRNPDRWVAGDEVPHEYGHLLHYWSWDGVGKWVNLCFDSDGDGHVDTLTSSGGDADGDGDHTDECTESASDREWAIAAFKEGWANFIKRVTFEGANVGKSCASIEHRTLIAPSFRLASGDLACPTTLGLPMPGCKEGARVIDDVEQTLCDLWDPTDPNPTPDENDDRLWISLQTLQQTLGLVWTTASDLEQLDVLTAWSFGTTNSATATLGLCRYAKSLIASGVGRSQVIETLANNRIACDL